MAFNARRYWLSHRPSLSLATLAKETGGMASFAPGYAVAHSVMHCGGKSLRWMVDGCAGRRIAPSLTAVASLLRKIGKSMLVIAHARYALLGRVRYLIAMK